MPLSFSHLLAFGDSVTLGGQASCHEQAWIQRLCRWLEEDRKGPVTLVNRAVGGSVLSPKSAAYPPSRKPSGQEQLEETLSAWPSPDLVLVAFGFNDARGGALAEAFVIDLAAFLGAIRARHAGKVVVLGPYANPDRHYYGEAWSHGSPERLMEFTRLGAETARSFGCLHLDLHTPLANGAGFYAADGVHPNDEGHLLIATRVYEVLGGTGARALGGR